MHISTPSAADSASIADVIDRSYGWGVRADPEKWQSWTRKIAATAPLYRMLTVDKQAVAICKVGARWLRVGCARVPSAEISEICVVPEHRGRGLGSALMKDALEQMRVRGIAISRLSARHAGLVPFYVRHGYERFPTRYARIALDHEPRIQDSDRVRIRSFDAGADLAWCVDLYHQFTHDDVGSLVWDAHQGGWRNPRRLVYADSARVRAYLYADPAFGHVGVTRSDIDLVGQLVAQASSIARGSGEKELLLKLPRDAEILEALRGQGLSVDLVEAYPNQDMNMLHVCDLNVLFRCLLPELCDRLRNGGRSLCQRSARVATDSCAVELAVQPYSIGLTKCDRPDAVVHLTHTQLLMLVLGTVTGDDAEFALSCDAGMVGLLHALFPPRRCTSGSEIWGPDNLELTQYSLVEALSPCAA